MNDAAAVPTSTPPSALSTGVNRGGGCGETPTWYTGCTAAARRVEELLGRPTPGATERSDAAAESAMTTDARRSRVGASLCAKGGDPKPKVATKRHDVQRFTATRAETEPLASRSGESELGVCGGV